MFKKLLCITGCVAIAVLIHAQTGRTLLTPSTYTGIKGQVRDAQTGMLLSARIVVADDTGHIYNSHYTTLPGFFTEDNGSFAQLLKPGHYTATVYHGIDYQSQKIPFTIADSNGVQAAIYLQLWAPLKKLGWYCGDGHNHLYTDKRPDTAMAATLRQVCLAQGIDFICAAQEWAGYNDSTWRNGYAKFSDSRFVLSYGSEMPKYRTGHTWWLGQGSTHGYFWNTMDIAYENQYYQAEQGTSWRFGQLAFPFIPDVEVVQRLKATEHAAAVIAHPTSWWMQKRGDIEKHVTNVAANIPFSLLGGKIWDGIVVMGYNHDHYFYQNLWFNILNEGYRMPALSELDGGFDRDDPKYYGSMRTYTQIKGAFSVAKIAAAVKAGKTFVTSGPIIIAHVDNKYGIGDVVPVSGKEHRLHIKAYAAGDAEDYLSYIVVYRNGQVYKLWDVRNEKPRQFDTAVTITEKEKAWYVVKAYGSHAWKSPTYLDIMQVCQKTDKTSYPDYGKVKNEVAITSPFYFWPKGSTEPGVLQSSVNINIISPLTHQPLNDVVVDILLGGKKIKTITLKNGKSIFSMPVNAVLKISAAGFAPIYRSLYLDYPPHLALLEELATGNWRNHYDSATFSPGEVPWEAFHFKEAKQVLQHVNWQIEMKPNERDGLWGELNRKLK